MEKPEARFEFHGTGGQLTSVFALAIDTSGEVTSMDVRKKHGWAFWLTLALIAAPLLYVTSFGPACWWFAAVQPAGNVPPMKAMTIYWPLGRVVIDGPNAVRNSLIWWITLAARPGGIIELPIEPGDMPRTVIVSTRSG